MKTKFKHKNMPINITAIGDCNTSGKHSTAQENLPNMLKAVLKERNIETNVINYGRAMLTTREGVELAKSVDHPVDILMVNFGLVDSWLTVLSHWYVLYYPDNLWRKIKRKALKSLKKRLRKPFIRRFFKLNNVISIDEYKDNLIKIIQTIRIDSPDAVIVLWGLAPARLDPNRETELIRYDEAINKVAQNYNAIYIPTRLLFESYETDYLYQDHVHIGLNGQRLIADAIVSKMVMSD